MATRINDLLAYTKAGMADVREAPADSRVVAAPFGASR
jgi:hypothetical protein